jgi:hypothetical protein
MDHRKLLGTGAALAVISVSWLGAIRSLATVSPSYDQISFSPAPIAANGSLQNGAIATVCVQAKLSGGSVVSGADIDLSFDNPSIPTDIPSGDTGTGGSAEVIDVADTPLSATPTAFPADTNCTPSGGGATEHNAVTIAYTSPDNGGSNSGAPYPIWGGRDSLTGSDPSNASDTNSIQYQFSPVTQYAFSTGSSIAPSGSLAPGQQMSFSVISEDANGGPVSDAAVNLSLSSTVSPGGAASASPTLQGGSEALNGTPTRFVTNSSGQVEVTYMAASALPTAGGQDVVTAQNHPTVVTISNSDAYTYAAYTGGYTVDAYGGLHPYGGAPYEPVAADYPGWNIIRGVTLDACDPTGDSGWTVDGYGGMHPFGNAPYVSVYGGYYPGWDIIRGAVAYCLDGQSVGYTVDAYGGLHPFSSDPGVVEPPYPQVSGYWAGQDLTAGIALIPGTDEGYVVDAYGGLHPFNGAPYYNVTGYYAGQDLISGVTLLPGGGGGYTVDIYGGLHPFGSAPYEPVTGYFPGQNIITGVAASSATGGYTVDAYGGLHPYGTAPYEAVSGYYPGQNLIKGVVFGSGG